MPTVQRDRRSGVLERSFKVLEHLVDHPQGRPLSSIAADLGIPLSASHRILTELIRCGYVRQSPQGGHYSLTIKLVSMGMSFLGNSGIVDVAQPLVELPSNELGVAASSNLKTPHARAPYRVARLGRVANVDPGH